jgi:hypothetical protein
MSLYIFSFISFITTETMATTQHVLTQKVTSEAITDITAQEPFYSPKKQTN